MVSSVKAKYIKLVCIAGLIVIIDQITKAVIINRFLLYESVSVIPGFFSITYIQNPGGAFGFLSDGGTVLRHIIFIGFSFFAICLLFYFYKTTPATLPILSAGFALILGGAAGNLIDRIRFGKVVDFLDFYIGRLHWPAFNIADSAVSVGMVIFLYHILFKHIPE